MMNKLFSILLALMLLALPLVSCAEESAAPLATLTVQGSASVTLQPDMAQVSVGVMTQAEAVAEASSANALAMDSVIAALKAAGIAQEDLATENYYVAPQYDYQYTSLGNSQKIIGYQVSNTLRVTVRQLDGLGQVLDAAMSAGANECYGITFLSSHANEATDQAMALAIAEANRKAELMAAAAGMQLVRMTSLKEGSTSYQGVSYNADFLAKGAPTTTILSNGLDFHFTVEAVYEIQ